MDKFKGLIMLKLNRLATAVIASSLATGSFFASAEQTTSSTATVTVQNAFTLTEVTALSFGTIGASASTAALATANHSHGYVTVDSINGTTSVEDAAGATVAETVSLFKIADGAPGEYTVSGTAPFTQMKITAPTAATLSNSAAPPANGVFLLSNFELSNADGEVITTDTKSAASATDLNGDLTFKLGARLTPAKNAANDAGAMSFIDGEYSGSFNVKVDY